MSQASQPDAAVVGHVEWIEFVRVKRLPRPGEIIHALESWQEVGGGGAVAAVQTARLGRGAHFFTALGDDEVGRRSKARLEELGVTVHAVFRPTPQRRAITFLEDEGGERTITTIGERLGASHDDHLPWQLLDSCRSCYYTAGDAQQARRAQQLVITTRVRQSAAKVRPDVWVGSNNDASESIEPESLEDPTALALTDGGNGTRLWTPDGGWARVPAATLPGEPVDSYGCGDSFAAGLAFGLGRGYGLRRAVELGSLCGAAVMCGRGPYSGQLRSDPFA